MMAGRRASTHASARAPLAGLLVALAIAVAIAVLWTDEGSEPERGVSPPVASEDPAAEPATDLPGAAGAPGSERVTALAQPLEAAAGSPQAGLLRGTVATPPGVPFPERWTLVVEPVEALEGSERAVRRELELDGTEREFDLRDLPLGGYAVSASAPGMSTRTTHVLLVKGSARRVMHMVMTPAGFIDGSLVEDGGAPAEGLTVTLVNMATGERRSTESDPAGLYLFEGVTDGRYTISFGDPVAPLLEAEELSFKAPSLRFPRRTIPHTCTVRFRVVDEFMNPLAGAAVRGFGNAGGPIDLFSDEAGVAVAVALPAGRYRVSADHESGRRGKATFELGASTREVSVEIPCRP